MELISKLPKEGEEARRAKYSISASLRKIIKRANSYKRLIEELPDNLSPEFYRRLSQMMPCDE